jgi:hypothetical protein
MLIRDLATFRARLLRLEAAEYALICSNIESAPSPTDEFTINDQELDPRELAASIINNTAALDHLQRAEIHLRRAYNRTWDRLERMQKAREKTPLDVSLKQSHQWATYEAQRTTCPKCFANDHPGVPLEDAWKFKVAPRHPCIDEKGTLIRPNEGLTDD